MKRRRWTIQMVTILVLSAIMASGYEGSVANEATGPLGVEELRCENLVEPLGIDVATPRLSWILTSSQQDTVQVAYRVLVADSAESLAQNEGNRWDSGWIESDQSIWVPYGDAEHLRAFDRCYWKVAVRDNHGNESAWSEPSLWTMGPMSEADWGDSQWIGYRPTGKNLPEQPQNAVRDYVKFGSAQWLWVPEEGVDPRQNAPIEDVLFRKSFELPADREVAWTKVIVTADDRFTIVMNQRPAQDQDGNPIANMRRPVGWTPNQITADAWKHVQEFDFTGYLEPGKNEIEIYAQNLPLADGRTDNNPAGMVAKFAIGFADGSRMEIPTDGSWECCKVTQGETEDRKPAQTLGNVHINTRPWCVVRAPSQWNWGQDCTSPIFRQRFATEDGKEIRYACATICGLGYYELRLNGQKVGNQELDPTFTDADHRVLYVTHDITDQLRDGKNVVGVMLGNGWYNQHAVEEWDFEQAAWRGRPKLRLVLRIEYTDGSVENIVSDETWEATCDGPVVLDGIRNGEVYDARREMDGWDTVDGAATATEMDCVARWESAQGVAAPKGTLTAQKAPPIRVVREIVPVDWTQVKPNVKVYDLGQNMVGRAKIEVVGPRGARVVMRYSERANDDGTIHRDEIDCYHHQGPFQQEEYTLRGSVEFEPEFYESRFTYHGFRYVEVTVLPPTDPAIRTQDGVAPELATVGARDLPVVESLIGRVLHTDFGETGQFTCSDDSINQTQANTLWSYRGNFVGIPTDCPHREKNGWTGDAQLACAMAMYNFDNAPAYVQWLRSVHEEQGPEGNLTGIAPSQNWGWWAGPAWDSAIIVIPWYLYVYTGDPQPLAEHYDAMAKFNDYLYGKMEADPNHVVDMALGDWVPAKTVTPQGVTCTGYLYFDSVALSQIANILGKPEDSAKYAKRAQIVRENFRKAYLKSDGTVSIGSQTAESAAIFMGFVTDPSERELVAAKLADAVQAEDYKIDTGIFGAKYLFRTLSETGNHEMAYRILMGREAPGYGAWLEANATTLWEAWSLKDAWAASLNHIMFGDISGWFYEYLAGIQLSQNPDQPLTYDPAGLAFKKIRFAPRPVGDLTSASGTIRTPYGELASSWKIVDGTFVYEVRIPVNTTAVVLLPYDGGEKKLGSGTYRFEVPVKVAPSE